MVRGNIFVFAFLFIGINSIAQNKYSDSIILQANLFAKATKNNDFKKIAAYTYPKLAEVLGGKDTLLSQVSNNMILLRREGLRYKSIVFNEPQKIYHSNNELYCVVPQKTIQVNSQGYITRDTFLVAISNNLGKTWFFLTDDQFTKYKNILFTHLDKQMVFPENNSTFKRNSDFTSFKKPN